MGINTAIIITYKEIIKFSQSATIVGTISGTLRFDPSIDFEHAKDQTAKTNKRTWELSIAKVKLEFNRGGTSIGQIDFK